MSDPVNHPPHYKSNGLEAINVIEAFGLDKDFCLGNVVKYVLRAGRKGAPETDLQKAHWYLTRRVRAGGDTHALFYLATPYTKYIHGLDQAADHAALLAAHIMQSGLAVYSPIVHGHALSKIGGIDPKDHSIWLPFNETMLSISDALIVAHLDGWQDSYGVNHEIETFRRTKRPIYDMDPTTLELTEREGEVE